MPIESSLFLSKFELIQSVIADMDLDLDLLSQVAEAFMSAVLLNAISKAAKTLLSRVPEAD